MNRNALIIFVRNPVLGKVKTRIARTVGEKAALQIYLLLLQHTHDITLNMDADKLVFYSDNLQPGDSWEEGIYQKFLQTGETLGDKMKNAFRSVFESGYEKAVIVGSDCYDLTTSIIETAFAVLKERDAVIGPANDGGYYLLGMKKLVPGIFDGKEWSTATVYSESIADCRKSGISYSVLPLLNDVDTVSDVPDELFRRIEDV